MHLVLVYVSIKENQKIPKIRIIIKLIFDL